MHSIRITSDIHKDRRDHREPSKESQGSKRKYMLDPLGRPRPNQFENQFEEGGTQDDSGPGESWGASRAPIIEYWGAKPPTFPFIS